MTTPYDKLVAKTPPEVLTAFEDSYRDAEILHGTCLRCGADIGEFAKHLAWHKSMAQQRWITSWQLDIIRFLNGPDMGGTS